MRPRTVASRVYGTGPNFWWHNFGVGYPELCHNAKSHKRLSPKYDAIFCHVTLKSLGRLVQLTPGIVHSATLQAKEEDNSNEPDDEEEGNAIQFKPP